MGPPQRKLTAREENMLSGRVSVYCVGASIDLQSLRAHVFRRGFGRKEGISKDDYTPDLTLTRNQQSDNPELDDEVLHVSNAPLFVAADNRLMTAWSDDGVDWDVERLKETDFDDVSAPASTSTVTPPGVSTASPLSSSSSAVSSGRASSVLSDELDSKTKEMLVMSTQDIFYFEYGCVVFWGLTSREEKAALTELAPFISTPVTATELENSFDTMEFVFDRTANPQRPIKFDRMKLRSLRAEEKLALSYAMAQSSKLFVFESRVLESVERTRFLPKELAMEGKISCSKKDLNRLIGQLFVEQTEVNLFSSILDTPDFLWDDDEYFPTYDYTRKYLEVDDRVELLNSRLTVIRELLDVLTAQVADNNSTRLEWIVIWLIAIEVILGIATNPLFAGKRMLAAVFLPAMWWFYKKFDTS